MRRLRDFFILDPREVRRGKSTSLRELEPACFSAVVLRTNILYIATANVHPFTLVCLKSFYSSPAFLVAGLNLTLCSLCIIRGVCLVRDVEEQRRAARHQLTKKDESAQVFHVFAEAIRGKASRTCKGGEKVTQLTEGPFPSLCSLIYSIISRLPLISPVFPG